MRPVAIEVDEVEDADRMRDESDDDDGWWSVLVAVGSSMLHRWERCMYCVVV